MDHLGLPQGFQKEGVAHLQLHLLSDHYDTPIQLHCVISVLSCCAQ